MTDDHIARSSVNRPAGPARFITFRIVNKENKMEPRKMPLWLELLLGCAFIIGWMKMMILPMMVGIGKTMRSFVTACGLAFGYVWHRLDENFNGPIEEREQGDGPPDPTEAMTITLVDPTAIGMVASWGGADDLT